MGSNKKFDEFRKKNWDIKPVFLRFPEKTKIGLNLYLTYFTFKRNRQIGNYREFRIIIVSFGIVYKPI